MHIERGTFINNMPMNAQLVIHVHTDWIIVQELVFIWQQCRPVWKTWFLYPCCQVTK